MKAALTILFEVLVLLGFALLYYFIQRRRIIRKDKIEIYDYLNEVVNELDESGHSSHASALKELNEQNDYSRLNDFINSPPAGFPVEIKEKLTHYQDRIAFYLRTK